jgi:membrane-bound lytic murein transglycosylase B
VPSDNAVFKLIAGNKGPGFLMLRNFFVLKRYNNSDFYALAVGLLADRIAGGKGMIQDWPRPAGSLRAEEKFELQELLQAQGFYSGAIDGHLGPATAKAIKGFQQKNGLAVDGKPTSRLLKLLQAGSNSRNERPASQ